MYSNREIVLCPRHASVDALEAERDLWRARLEFYLMFRGEERGSAFIEFEMRILAGEDPIFAEWVSEIDAARALSLASPQSSSSPSEGDARDQAGVER